MKALVAEYPDSAAPMGAYALFLADRSRPAEAFAVVDAYQKRRPADPIGWFQVGRVAAATGQQLDRGEEALRKFIAATPPPSPTISGPPTVPTLATAHVRLGNIAERRGNKAAARAEYQRALALDPRSNLAKRSLEAVK
jgi:tetratricopeptide (TPR) repeat protein